MEQELREPTELEQELIIRNNVLSNKLIEAKEKLSKNNSTFFKIQIRKLVESYRNWVNSKKEKADADKHLDIIWSYVKENAGCKNLCLSNKTYARYKNLIPLESRASGIIGILEEYFEKERNNKTLISK